MTTRQLRQLAEAHYRQAESARRAGNEAEAMRHVDRAAHYELLILRRRKVWVVR